MFILALGVLSSCEAFVVTGAPRQIAMRRSCSSLVNVEMLLGGKKPAPKKATKKVAAKKVAKPAKKTSKPAPKKAVAKKPAKKVAKVAAKKGKPKADPKLEAYKASVRAKAEAEKKEKEKRRAMGFVPDKNPNIIKQLFSLSMVGGGKKSNPLGMVGGGSDSQVEIPTEFELIPRVF